MHIHRIITKGVPGLPDQDLTFWDEWTDKPLDSVLITGPNGSGKTTLLNVIAGLWDAFGYWIRGTVGSMSRQISPESARLEDLGARAAIAEAYFAAIEIRDLFPQPVWLFVHNASKAVINIKSITQSDYFIGETIGARGQPAPGLNCSVELLATRWLEELENKMERLVLGAVTRDQSIPNILLFTTQNRYISPTDRPDNSVKPESIYQWLTHYRPATQWDRHVEAMLRNLKVRDPEWFYQTREQINGILRQNGRELTDFDNDLRVRVYEIKTGKRYPLNQLSGGEQQIVIFLFMINRWMMNGGVVLIDEADMNVHPSWQRLLISELKSLVAAKQGQLIVTSHSPHTWEAFHSGQRFDLATLPEVEPIG